MATDKRISELPVGVAILDTDLFADVQGAGVSTVQVSASQLAAYMQQKLISGAAITFQGGQPQNTTGKNGDMSVNTATNQFFLKSAGAWGVAYAVPLGAKSVNTILPDGLGNVSLTSDNVPQGISNMYFSSSAVRVITDPVYLPLNGAKPMTGVLNANLGLDVDGTTGYTTLAIGTNNATVINIGNPGVVINMIAKTINEQAVQNMNVADKLITLNKNGPAGSASNVGFQIEEGGAGIYTGYFTTTADRNGFMFQGPGVAFPGSLDFSLLSAAHVLKFPNANGTIATQEYLSALTSPSGIGNAAITGQPLSGLVLTTGGVITATDTILTAQGKLQNQITNMPVPPAQVIYNLDTVLTAGNTSTKAMTVGTVVAGMVQIGVGGYTMTDGGSGGFSAKFQGSGIFYHLTGTAGGYVYDSPNGVIFTLDSTGTGQFYGSLKAPYYTTVPQAAAPTPANGVQYYSSATNNFQFYQNGAWISYLTANQNISLTGGATGSGTTSITVSLNNAAVTGQVLTGLSLATGGVIASTDSILSAQGKLQYQISHIPTNYLTANQNITISGDASGSGTTSIALSLNNTSVTGQVLTGLNLATGGVISATDTLLSGQGKLQYQISHLPAPVTPTLDNVLTAGRTSAQGITVGYLSITSTNDSNALYFVSGSTSVGMLSVSTLAGVWNFPVANQYLTVNFLGVATFTFNGSGFQVQGTGYFSGNLQVGSFLSTGSFRAGMTTGSSIAYHAFSSTNLTGTPAQLYEIVSIGMTNQISFFAEAYGFAAMCYNLDLTAGQANYIAHETGFGYMERFDKTAGTLTVFMSPSVSGASVAAPGQVYKLDAAGNGTFAGSLTIGQSGMTAGTFAPTKYFNMTVGGTVVKVACA